MIKIGFTQMDTDISTDRHGNLLYGELTYLIRGVCFQIRKEYGVGQKEVIYQRLLAEKLQRLNLQVEREKRIEVLSRDTGKVVGFYQPDLVVDSKIVIEVKSARITLKDDEKQLYFYLRNSDYELGLLVNFSTPKLYIKRIIYTNDKKSYARGLS